MLPVSGVSGSTEVKFRKSFANCPSREKEFEERADASMEKELDDLTEGEKSS